MSEDYVERKIREAKRAKECRKDIEDMVLKHGAKAVLKQLGEVLSGAEAVGNGYSVGRVLIELSEVEW